MILYVQSDNFVDDVHALKEITREFTRVGIVILADNLDQAGLDLAITCGACGFLPKNITGDELRLSLELILLDENLCAVSVWPARERPIVAPPLAATKERALRTPLSPRERAILNCLELGLPNKTIARKLDMAEATVKVHLKSVLRKINVGNRTQAAVWAKNHRLSSA